MEVYGNEVELVPTIFKSKLGTDRSSEMSLCKRARRKVERGSNRDRTLLRPRLSHSTELDSGYGLISTQLANRRHAFHTIPLKDHIGEIPHGGSRTTFRHLPRFIFVG
jgi:hypothetical protein